MRQVMSLCNQVKLDIVQGFKYHTNLYKSQGVVSYVAKFIQALRSQHLYQRLQSATITSEQLNAWELDQEPKLTIE